RFDWPERMDRVSTHQLFWLRWWQGRAGELDDEIASASATLPSQWLMFDLYSGLVRAQRDDREGVRSVLDATVPVVLRPTGGGWAKPAELVFVSELALAAGDRPTLELLFEAVRRQSGLHAHNTLCCYIAPCDLVIGRLAAALGDPDAALTSLEAAVAFTEAV